MKKFVPFIVLLFVCLPLFSQEEKKVNINLQDSSATIVEKGVTSVYDLSQDQAKKEFLKRLNTESSGELIGTFIMSDSASIWKGNLRRGGDRTKLEDVKVFIRKDTLQVKNSRIQNLYTLSVIDGKIFDGKEIIKDLQIRNDTLFFENKIVEDTLIIVYEVVPVIITDKRIGINSIQLSIEEGVISSITV